MLNLTTETLGCLAEQEIQQLNEEGRKTSSLESMLEDIAEGKTERREGLDEFFKRAGSAAMRDDFQYHEPSGWETIVDTCGIGPEAGDMPPADVLRDRIHGAWLGRCAGCMLGKPVEGRTHQEIRSLLQIAGEYPLNDYFPAIEDTGDLPYPSAEDPTLRPNITHSVRDDDTDYTILGLHLMKSYGEGLTRADVGSEWLRRLPYMKTYTAERAAYRNLVFEIPAEEAAIVLNPYREWIGAQIRADAFGYCHPGRPFEAARLAWQDAALSHVKNGVYGELFFAAMIADALVSDAGDLRGLIERAVEFVPPESRFAAMVREVLEWCADDETWEATFAKIEDAFGEYHHVHTINNAALVLMGLVHGDGDFKRTICTTVLGGWDTDCTGATAGSVMGALLGAERLPARWTEPLNDTLHTSLDYTVSAISDLAAETVSVGMNLAK